MTNPVTPTPISALPPAPLVTDTPAEFDDKAYPFVQALDLLRSQINTAAGQTNQNAVASKEGADDSNTSAAASAASAAASAASATTASGHADRAEDAEQAALVAAAAAGAAAGLPTLVGNAGKALIVNPSATGVLWGSSGLEVGGVYQGSKKPTVGVWLDTDAVYLQSSYPVLFTALGLVPGVAPWTQRTPGSLVTTRGLAYGNGVFVAVGDTSTTGGAATSTDGITWTARTIAISAFAVTFGAGVFVAVGTNSVATSPDGITWTTRTIPNTAWRAISYGAGVFVAIGAGSTVTSPDGITWTARTSVAANMGPITYGGGRFVVLSQSAAGGGATSVDGISWTAITTVAGVTPNSVAYGAGVFVAVGTSGAMTSPDGLVWTARPIPGAGTGSASYQAVTVYNGRFIAVGSPAAGAPLFADSPDGSTWTARFMPAGGYTSILATAGLIVAAGSLMQTAPMFPYNTATQFYVPAPLGVVGLDTWMKAGD